jgi:hypothetical protein
MPLPEINKSMQQSASGSDALSGTSKQRQLRIVLHDIGPRRHVVLAFGLVAEVIGDLRQRT